MAARIYGYFYSDDRFPMAEINYRNLRVGSAFLVFGQAFQALLAFAVNLVLVRYIFPNEFGRFALILAGASIVYSVVSPRVNILIIRLADARYTDAAKDRYFSAITFETLAATSIILLWLALAGDVGFWEPALVGAIGLRHWTDQNKAFYERTMPYRKLAFIETGVATIGHLSTLFLVLAGAGWNVLFIREIIISVSSLLSLWWIGGLTLRRLKFLSLKDWRDLIRDARGVWLDGVLEGSFQRLTILLAGLLSGEAAAGLFFQAQRLATVPLQLLAPIVSRIAANWFGRMEDAQARIAGRTRLLWILFPPLLLAGLLTVLFADPVVPWLFGDAWARVGTIVAAMGGVVVFSSLFETLKAYCLSTRQTRKILAARAVQYTGLLAMVAAGYFGWLTADISLALGLSAAYFLAFTFVFVVLRFKETRRDRP